MIMVEQQYLAPSLSHPDSLSGAPNLRGGARSSVVTPQTSTYPELSSYGAVTTSFNLPPQCDSSALLTPISTADSPPLHQCRKVLGQYPPPPNTPGTQQPTPPGSSKMYHHQWGHFEMTSQSSQTSSPMAPQSAVAPDFLDSGYLQDGRRTPGAPSQQYMGAFGVSDGPESQPIGQPYYVPVGQVDHHTPVMMREGQQIHMSMHHREVPTAPLLNEPHPSQFRPGRPPSPEDQVIHGLQESQRSMNGSPRRRPLAAPGRVKKRTAKSRGVQSRNIMADDPVNEHKNCMGHEVPPILKSSCPDEERCIFESRWKHRNQKGQDMWESIQNDFKERFNRCPGKEMLQMKFKRGRSKYIHWLDQDHEILIEAWHRVEKQRYQMMLDAFYKLGGSRNMRLSASDIEVKVVNDLKLEEGLYMESHGDAYIRRRRKSATTKKRTAPRGMEGPEVPMSDEMMSVSSHNTHEDDVINQVHGRRDVKFEEDPSGGHEMMNMPIWDPSIPVKMEHGLMPQRTDQIPRHPGDHMLRGSPGTQPVYGRRRGS